MRYEIKFLVDTLTFPEILSLTKLHSAGFKEIYHERFINNIYFDSPEFQNYYENFYGLASRAKFRVRWYGDFFGEIKDPVLEIKSKEGHVGSKEKFSLPSFSFEDNCSLSFTSLFKKADLPDSVQEKLKLIQPTLANRYLRKYFLSADRKFRLTLDSQLSFFKYQPLRFSSQNKRADSESVILELKFDQENYEEAEMITNAFPFRVSRFSKYCSGLDRLAV